MYENHYRLTRLPKAKGSSQNLYQFLRDASQSRLTIHNPPFALVTRTDNGKLTAVCHVFEWDFDARPARFTVRVLVTAHRNGHKTRMLENMTRMENGLTIDGVADVLARTSADIESLRSIGLDFLDSLREL